MVKKIQAISDNPTVLKAIELSLQNYYLVHGIIVNGTNQLGRSETPAQILLIIIAVSASTGEPIAMLHRAGLGDCLGHIPILITSERQFDTFPDWPIQYLEYPFKPETLFNRVRQMLSQSNGLASGGKGGG